MAERDLVEHHVVAPRPLRTELDDGEDDRPREQLLRRAVRDPLPELELPRVSPRGREAHGTAAAGQLLLDDRRLRRAPGEAGRQIELGHGHGRHHRSEDQPVDPAVVLN
jgi:hypothetical protein